MEKIMMQLNLITQHVSKGDRKQMNVVGIVSNVSDEYEPIDSGYNEEVYFMGH